MAADNKVTITRILQIVVPIASVTIALVSLFLGLASRRKELDCVYLGSDKLVSLSANVAPALVVQYQGQSVSSLSKMNFVIRNSGAAAIKGTDIVEPLELAFPGGARILSATMERTSPSDFSFVTTLSQNKGCCRS